MAVPVTRHGLITGGESPKQGQSATTGPQAWRLLAAGIDTLDLSFYVDWGDTWDSVRESLEAGKARAEQTEGILWDDGAHGECIIFAGGKPPMYRYRLQLPNAHLAVAKSGKPGKWPNVYASPSAESLWRNGIAATVESLTGFIQRLGGKVVNACPSRCDVCADFQVPDGLALDFIRGHAVSKSDKSRHIMKGEHLETYYAGAAGADIQARIYNKSAEIQSSGKFWFENVWQLWPAENVWRVEFQLRRQALRQYGLNTMPALLKLLPALWESLCRDWFSLRLQDDSNTTRRSVHPWWAAVEQAAERLGASPGKIKRDYTSGPASMAWYSAHLSGLLLSMAVRAGLPHLEDAIGEAAATMREYWRLRDFPGRYRVAAIKLGLSDENEEEAEARP
jgi:hypothetical protein